MWKLTCLVAAFTAAGFAAGSGRILYSPLQPAVPFGASIKMTPDPSSIWSWHEDVTASGNLTIPVFIDIDGNGEMDTNDPWRRVLVTDMQFVGTTGLFLRVALIDENGDLWDMTQLGSQNPTTNQTYHLSTPLVLTPMSTLSVDLEAAPSTAYRARIHLVGRVVNL